MNWNELLQQSVIIIWMLCFLILVFFVVSLASAYELSIAKELSARRLIAAGIEI